MSHEKRSFHIGNSSLGAKFYFALGFLISAALNISGIANLLDIFVEWIGIAARIVALYDAIIVNPVSYAVNFLISLLHIPFQVPVWIIVYISVCMTFGTTLYFFRKFFNVTIEGKLGLLSKPESFTLIPQAIFACKFVYNKFQNTKNSAELFGLVAFSLVLLPVTVVIFIASAVFLLFPFVILQGTLVSLGMFFFHDFRANIDEMSDDQKMRTSYFRNVYNSTITFWSCIFCLAITIGVLIKFNDTLADFCAKNEENRKYFICKS